MTPLCRLFTRAAGWLFIYSRASEHRAQPAAHRVKGNQLGFFLRRRRGRCPVSPGPTRGRRGS
jgi:hypothetical protein